LALTVSAPEAARGQAAAQTILAAFEHMGSQAVPGGDARGQALRSCDGAPMTATV
jgi:hypothetical protein